jgi:hypothetical protein
LSSNSKIENCYALGDVFADDPYSGGGIYAGGLVGESISTDGVYRSFARGSVTAQTNNSNSPIYAGGLIGALHYGSMENCAALGETMTAKGSNSTYKAAARIYGSPATDIGVNNRALDVMYLETWNAYRYGMVTPVTPIPNATGPHGADAVPGMGSGALGTAAFWTTTMGFNSSTDSPAGTWNMSGVARGYPRLAWQ